MASGEKTKEITHPGAHLGHYLVVYHRDGARVAPLRNGRTLVVGRMPPADLVIDDDSLSRQHARFVLVGDEVMVKDLGSTNGTWVGGNRVDGTAVRSGAVLMLGAVTAVVHSLGDLPQLGLDGHDRFVANLDREITRARHFGRPLTLMFLRAPREPHLHRWVHDVQARLRPIDSVAVYSPDTIEVLLPETSEKDAQALAQGILKASDKTLLCGLSSFPEAATSLGGLIELCSTAARQANADRPLQVAPSTVVLEQAPSDESIVVQSRAMRDVLEIGRRVARGVIPVLLHGETGTGKEVVSRFIHQNGPRRDKPLVAVNCAAIPAQLVESTLFGHEKGAFTGATQMNRGVFEAANGGTLLLDEVGELPASVQSALLRVLETQKITRVGSTKEIAVDVRVIAASHRDLEEMAERGQFRRDLLFRLNTMILELPPLRARREDVAGLATHFLDGANQRNQTSVRSIDSQALAALEAYDWPGNIRELRNAMERAVVIAEHDAITLHDLPRPVREAMGVPVPPPAAPPSEGARLLRDGESIRACMERLEAEVLMEALALTEGNRTAAAKRLQMPRRTFFHKLRQYGLKDGEADEADD